MSAVRFTTSFGTPKCPYGREVEVTFDVGAGVVTMAEYVDNGRPLKGRSLAYLRASVEDAVERMGWEQYRKLRNDLHT